MTNMEDKIKGLMDAESRRLRQLYREAADAVMKDENPVASMIAKCAGVLVGSALVYAAMVSGTLKPQRPVSQPEIVDLKTMPGMTYLLDNAGTEPCIRRDSPAFNYGPNAARDVVSITFPHGGNTITYVVCEEQQIR